MYFFRIPNSIVIRLFLLGLCIVLFGAVMRYLTLSNFMREDLAEVIDRQQFALANYVARDVDFSITRRRALLENLAGALPIYLLEQPEQLRSWLKKRYDYQSTFFSEFLVADLRGKVVADFPVLSGRRGAEYEGRDEIWQSPAFRWHVGRPYLDQFNQPVLPMAVPIEDGQGNALGILVGISELGAPGFLDGLQENRSGGMGSGFLLVSPRDRLFVTASQADMVLKPTPPPGVDKLHDRAMAGYRGTGLTTNMQGVEELSAIVSVPSADWFIVAHTPATEAFAAVERARFFLIRDTLLAIVVFVLLLVGALYLTFRPLQRAAEQAKRMALDEMELEPLPVARNDEIGYLVSAFNKLLGKLTASQAALKRDLDAARQIQVGMLPPPPLFAGEKGIDSCGFMRAASQVGGDFYDAFPLADGKLFVAVGDVCNKGVSAALYMMRTLTVLRSLSMRPFVDAGEHLVWLAARCNEHLCQANESHQFVTLCLAIIDLSAGRIDFVNAGHNPPLLRLPNEMPAFVNGTRNPLVGMFPDLHYQASHCEFPPGSLFLLYTDGVTEAEAYDGVMFGEQALLGLLVDRDVANAEACIQSIVDKLDTFVGQYVQSDDITLLAIYRPIDEKTLIR